MFLWVFMTTALALTSIQTQILTEEIDVAFSPEVNDNLSLLLGLDAFQKLDVDGDGFLSKQEIKPYVSHYLEIASQYLTEHGGKVVLREKFEKNIVVPDLGAIGSEFNTKYCYLDYAFTETSASDLWTEAFGEVYYVSVEEFVEHSFEALQGEIKAPVQNVMNKIKDRKSIASFDRTKMPYVKLDDYSKGNAICESRRELAFLPGAAAVLGFGQLVGTWALLGMAESGIGCTWDVLVHDDDWCTAAEWAENSAMDFAFTALGGGALAAFNWFRTGSAQVVPGFDEVVPDVGGWVEDTASDIGESIGSITDSIPCVWPIC